MTDERLRLSHARRFRILRKIHRVTAMALFAFFIVMAITGILLGMKKHCTLLQAETAIGSSQDVKNFLSIDSLNTLALKYLAKYGEPDLSKKFDRIEIRAGKGIVKYTFAGHFTGLQIDATTGKLLKIENRTSDLIEMFHDGSIIDRTFGLKSGAFKVIYTLIMGVALLIFVITGLIIRRRNK